MINIIMTTETLSCFCEAGRLLLKVFYINIEEQNQFSVTVVVSVNSLIRGKVTAVCMATVKTADVL